MSLTTSERKVTLDHKITPAEDFKAFEVGDEGIVEAIVSVTNIKDDVDDIIQPGAYAKTLAMRKPKGVFGHDWSIPVAKTLAIEEWMPGDSRLPARLQAVNAGGLYVKAQFNLKTQRGRDAFEDVKFFGPESEFSIGYAVPAGGATVDPKTGIRLIKELELFEYSPVLFGAAPMTEALSVKRTGSKVIVEEKPYHIEKDGDNYVVVNSDTGKPVPGGSHSTREEATAHLRALYANVPDASKADDTRTHNFEGDEDSVCLTCGLPESASIHDVEKEDEDEKSLATCAEHFVASTHDQKTVQHCGLPLGHIGSHALLTTEESEMAKKDAAPKEVETPGGEVPVEVAKNETTSATTEQLSGDLQEALARDAETSGGGEAKDDGAEKAAVVETEVKETVPDEGADNAPEEKPEDEDEAETTDDAPEEAEEKAETEVPEVEASETASPTIKEKLQRLDAMIDDLLGQLAEEDEVAEAGKDAQAEAVTPKMSVEISHGSYEKVSEALSEIRESLFVSNSEGAKQASWTEETLTDTVVYGVADYVEGQEDEWGNPEIDVQGVKYYAYGWKVEEGKVLISELMPEPLKIDSKINQSMHQRFTPVAGEKVVSAVEAKEGRTLSAANAEKIRKAVQSLVDVLSQAGIEVEGSDDEKVAPDTENKDAENTDSEKETDESEDSESKTDEKPEPTMVTLSPKELMDLQLQALKASL